MPEPPVPPVPPVPQVVAFPIDSGPHLRAPGGRRPGQRDAPWGTLAAISAGGMLGALARYGLSTAFPHPSGGFPWATFAINATGCLLIGVLMVVITEVWQAHPLTRPFLGIGILGGFTTFSTYIVDIQQTLTAGAPRTALAYLAGTAVAALAAVYLGVYATRLLVRARRRRHKDRT